MLYTIGYAGHNFLELVEILKRYGITHIIDVRTKPFSRDKSFNRPVLSQALSESGLNYIWAGKKLGGLGEISNGSIQWLKEFQVDKTACVMCMESEPSLCHRYYVIGKQLELLGIKMKHIKVVKRPVPKYWILGEENQTDMF